MRATTSPTTAQSLGALLKSARDIIPPSHCFGATGLWTRQAEFVILCAQ